MELQRDAILGKRILLVDDERVVRDTIKLLLATDQHHVVEANNGAEALGLFIRGRFDLVVTDCEMPFIKGNELAAKIRRIAPTQPILMISGYGHKPGRDNPVDAVLDKPFKYDRLQSEMSKLFSENEESLPAACPA